MQKILLLLTLFLPYYSYTSDDHQLEWALKVTQMKYNEHIKTFDDIEKANPCKELTDRIINYYKSKDAILYEYLFLRTEGGGIDLRTRQQEIDEHDQRYNILKTYKPLFTEEQYRKAMIDCNAEHTRLKLGSLNKDNDIEEYEFITQEEINN